MSAWTVGRNKGQLRALEKRLQAAPRMRCFPQSWFFLRNPGWQLQWILSCSLCLCLSSCIVSLCTCVCLSVYLFLSVSFPPSFPIAPSLPLACILSEGRLMSGIFFNCRSARPRDPISASPVLRFHLGQCSIELYVHTHTHTQGGEGC